MDNSQTYDLAIFELVIYVILAPPALFVLFRHGLKGLLGWFFLHGFLILQLVAAGLIIHAGKNMISTTGALISQVGLSPLLLAVEGSLSELYRTTNVNSMFFKLVPSIIYHLTVVAAAVLVGVGSGSLYSTNPSSSAEGEVRGGVIILILAWAYLAFLVGKALLQFKSFGQMRWLLLGGVVAIPALAIRIVFSAVNIFDRSTNDFNPITGNIAARVVMEILPVMITATALVIAGLITMGASKDLHHSRNAP